VNHEPRVPRDDVNVTARHPLKDGAVMLAGVVVVAGLIFGVAVLLVEQLVPYVPPSWEARLFPDFGLMEHTPDSPEQEAQLEVLNTLLERLEAHWPERPETLRVGLLDTDGVNALAFPGGLILVTTGLMTEVQSENELAFVIGHELGHYHGRDHLRSLGRGVALATILALLGQSGTVGELVGISSDLSTRGFSREQEEQADAFGLGLVESEFGHVHGATDFFDRLPAPESAIERALATYLATHPLNDERVRSIEQLARDRDWKTEGETTALAR